MSWNPNLKACDMQSRADLTESDLMVLPDFPYHLEGVSEGAKNLWSLKLGKTIEVGVKVESNGVEVALKPRPSVKLLCIGSFNHGSFSSWESSRQVNQETMSGGTGRIVSPNGAWSRKWDRSKSQRGVLLIWKSLDKESAIEFEILGTIG